MDIYILLPAPEVAADLAKRLKSRRLARNLTQAGLAARSGVPLGTLKKFERTGAISLVSFVRLLVALGEQAGLERLMETDNRDSLTLDQILSTPKARKRGRIT
ncbi:MAG: helix-turn-helix transcriptional regulator [Proteobacteria bacterium]|nr:helix-turn-helix transcriptional regulator [Pseudomonadota bacterium]MYJ94422.1 helix-turn-helix transcriptional regulator [Pseudomonadota bacterium]